MTAPLPPKDPPPVAGLHLVKTRDAALSSAADDIRDIIHAELHGRVVDDSMSRREQEEEHRAEVYFWSVVARHIDERLVWARGNVRVIELGNRDGYHITLSDKEGRPYEVQVYYDDLVEVAMVQRAWDTEQGPVLMAGHIVDKLQQARQRYFERMFGPTISS